MERLLLLSLLFISLASCVDKSHSSHVDASAAITIDTIARPQSKTYTDSTVRVSGDNSYKLALHIFDTANDYDAERNNAVLITLSFSDDEESVFLKGGDHFGEDNTRNERHIN